MPEPSSRTSITRLPPTSRLEISIVSPISVYLTAFSSRVSSAIRLRVGLDANWCERAVAASSGAQPLTSG
jgi:hypothetical protein